MRCLVQASYKLPAYQFGQITILTITNRPSHTPQYVKGLVPIVYMVYIDEFG